MHEIPAYQRSASVRDQLNILRLGKLDLDDIIRQDLAEHLTKLQSSESLRIAEVSAQVFERYNCIGNMDLDPCEEPHDPPTPNVRQMSQMVESMLNDYANNPNTTLTEEAILIAAIQEAVEVPPVLVEPVALSAFIVSYVYAFVCGTMEDCGGFADFYVDTVN